MSDILGKTWIYEKDLFSHNPPNSEIAQMVSDGHWICRSKVWIQTPAHLSAIMQPALLSELEVTSLVF